MKPNDIAQLLHWNDIRLVDKLATKNNMMLVPSDESHGTNPQLILKSAKRTQPLNIFLLIGKSSINVHGFHSYVSLLECKSAFVLVKSLLQAPLSPMNFP